MRRTWTVAASKTRYEVAVGQVGALAARRQAVTATYLATNTALVAALAFLFKDGTLPGQAQAAAAIVLLGAGAFACELWRRLVLRYSVLLDWWYGLLRESEAILPADDRLFTREYEDLYASGRDDPRRAGHSLTQFEASLPRAFVAVYCLFALCLLAVPIVRAIQAKAPMPAAVPQPAPTLPTRVESAAQSSHEGIGADERAKTVSGQLHAKRH